MGESEPGEFEAWYQALHPRVLASLILIMGNGEAAREATDEAFTRAYQHWRRVARMASPDAWTFTVARNVARRGARRARQERSLLRVEAAGASSSVPAPAGEAWTLVAALPERQRAAIVLRHVADLTEPEIARDQSWRRRRHDAGRGSARRQSHARTRAALAQFRSHDTVTDDERLLEKKRRAAQHPDRTGEHCNAPAGTWTPVVDHARCQAKHDCVDVCPNDVFEVRRIDDSDYAALGLFAKLRVSAHKRQTAYTPRADDCHACGLCVVACPEHAITLLPPVTA